MKTKNKVGLAIGVGCACIAFILAYLVAVPFLVPLEPIEGTMYVELGDEPDTNIENYVEGIIPAMWVSRLDVSEVDNMKVGIYTATVRHGFQLFEYEIRVKDTTAPELTLLEDGLDIQAGKEYEASYFVKESFDLSGQVAYEVALKNDSKNSSENIVIDERGEYKLEVTAYDAQDNATEEVIEIFVDTSPELQNVKEFYLVPGSEVDYLEGVVAMDEEDGDVTSDIEVDTDDIDLDTVGEYEAVYTVEDSRGFITETTVMVNVMSADDIQELINTREINRNEAVIEGAYNVYDRGYYTDASIYDVMDEMLPCIVHLKVPTMGFGSGFIIQITDEEVIICTNEHVAQMDENFEVHFFDGTMCPGEVVYTNAYNDVGFITVQLDEVPEELLDQLYTVHINKNYWEELDNEADIEVGIRTIKENGEHWQDRVGDLIYKETEMVIKLQDKNSIVCETDTRHYRGSSGSAVFDSSGNLIGMVYAYSSGSVGRHDYNIPLNQICDDFKEAFGRDVFYY